MSMYRRRLMIANALKSSDGNINYPGLIAAWSAKGKSNDDADRAILKDLTGNGHDITLNWFAFSGMSGYDGYSIDFKTEYAPTLKLNRVSGTLTSNKITITSVIELNNFLESNRVEKHKSYKIKVTGVNDDLYIRYFYSAKGYYNIKTEGIHILPESDEVQFIGFRATKVSDSCNITIELIPEYPDALVFDGIDDYGVNRSVPSLSDYTIIVKKKALNNKGVVCATIGNFGEVAFVISDKFNRDNGMVFANSFSRESLVKWVDNISYQTKNSYNGKTISVGKIITTHGFSISMYGGQYWKGAFYSAYLFNRSLDEQEIKAFIRKYIDPEYLLPSEIPTPDCYYDFSLGSNDDENKDTIKDLSGNGNDAVAHNFAWSGMSGYGGYVTNFYNTKENTITADIQNNKLNVTNITGNGKFAYTWAHSYPDIINNSYKIQVNGLKDTMNLVYRYYDKNKERKEVNIAKDGVYQIPSGYGVQGTETIDYSGFNVSNFTGERNLIIEMIPEYPGALVFDGVDDYVSLDAFDSGFKTMFMVCNQRNKSNAFLYDQRKNTEPPYDYGLYTYNNVAYNMRNANGTYINGIKNTKVFTKDLNNKKILISVNSKLTQLNKPTISVGITGSYSDMALYKFLGFKKALTEEQIQAVIKKYKLLDGVDEIEVS